MRTLLVVSLLSLTAVAWSGEGKRGAAVPPPATAPAPAAQTAAAPPAGTPTPAAMVAYREAEMMAVAKHFKAMSLIGKGEVVRPQGEFIAHAEALHALSLDLVSQFPAGTGPGAVKTEARAEIWSDAAGFAAAAKAFEDATASTLAGAKANDAEAVKAGMSAIGQSCGGCHESFRAED